MAAPPGKYAAPKHPLLLERKLDKMVPPDKLRNHELQRFYETGLNNNLAAPVQTAYATQYVKHLERLKESEIDKDWRDDFRAWMCGNSKFNTKISQTPWESKPLFHVKGVRDFLSSELDMHWDFRKKLITLQTYGPGDDLNQIYLYYKFIVRAHHWADMAKASGGDPVPPWYRGDGMIEFLDMYKWPSNYMDGAPDDPSNDVHRPGSGTPKPNEQRGSPADMPKKMSDLKRVWAQVQQAGPGNTGVADVAAPDPPSAEDMARAMKSVLEPFFNQQIQAARQPGAPSVVEVNVDGLVTLQKDFIDQYRQASTTQAEQQEMYYQALMEAMQQQQRPPPDNGATAIIAANNSASQAIIDTLNQLQLQQQPPPPAAPQVVYQTDPEVLAQLALLAETSAQVRKQLAESTEEAAQRRTAEEQLRQQLEASRLQMQQQITEGETLRRAMQQQQEQERIRVAQEAQNARVAADEQLQQQRNLFQQQLDALRGGNEEARQQQVAENERIRNELRVKYQQDVAIATDQTRTQLEQQFQRRTQELEQQNILLSGQIGNETERERRIEELQRGQQQLEQRLRSEREQQEREFQELELRYQRELEAREKVIAGARARLAENEELTRLAQQRTAPPPVVEPASIELPGVDVEPVIEPTGTSSTPNEPANVLAIQAQKQAEELTHEALGNLIDEATDEPPGMQVVKKRTHRRTGSLDIPGVTKKARNTDVKQVTLDQTLLAKGKKDPFQEQKARRSAAFERIKSQRGVSALDLAGAGASRVAAATAIAAGGVASAVGSLASFVGSAASKAGGALAGAITALNSAASSGTSAEQDVAAEQYDAARTQNAHVKQVIENGQQQVSDVLSKPHTQEAVEQVVTNTAAQVVRATNDAAAAGEVLGASGQTDARFVNEKILIDRQFWQQLFTKRTQGNSFLANPDAVSSLMSLGASRSGGLKTYEQWHGFWKEMYNNIGITGSVSDELAGDAANFLGDYERVITAQASPNDPASQLIIQKHNALIVDAGHRYASLLNATLSMNSSSILNSFGRITYQGNEAFWPVAMLGYSLFKSGGDATPTPQEMADIMHSMIQAKVVKGRAVSKINADLVIMGIAGYLNELNARGDVQAGAKLEELLQHMRSDKQLMSALGLAQATQTAARQEMQETMNASMQVEDRRATVEHADYRGKTISPDDLHGDYSEITNYLQQNAGVRNLFSGEDGGNGAFTKPERDGLHYQHMTDTEPVAFNPILHLAMENSNPLAFKGTASDKRRADDVSTPAYLAQIYVDLLRYAAPGEDPLVALVNSGKLSVEKAKDMQSRMWFWSNLGILDVDGEGNVVVTDHESEVTLAELFSPNRAHAIVLAMQELKAADQNGLDLNAPASNLYSTFAANGKSDEELNQRYSRLTTHAQKLITNFSMVNAGFSNAYLVARSGKQGEYINYSDGVQREVFNKYLGQGVAQFITKRKIQQRMQSGTGASSKRSTTTTTSSKATIST